MTHQKGKKIPPIPNTPENVAKAIRLGPTEEAVIVHGAGERPKSPVREAPGSVVGWVIRYIIPKLVITLGAA